MGRDTQPFPTGRQVYHRVRWDPRFDETRYHIGFAERSGRIKEKPLSAWNPHGDIPWHRVQYVRCEDTRVWDREARVDLVMSAAPPHVVAPDTSGLSPLPLYAWRSGAWSEGAPAMPVGGALRVATWNVLAIEHDPELEPFEERAHRAITQLAALNADVLFLQEADAFWLDALARTAWVRAGWSMSASPEAPGLLEPHGILCLTRVHLDLEVLEFKAPKHALLAHTPALTLASVHLTSNRAQEAELKRRTQLARLLSLTREASSLLVLGDFNMREPHEAHELLEPHALRDVWLELCGGDPGLTYDPGTNPLAAATSTTGLAARFDRVLLRGKRWHACHIERTATDASDHHALCVDLQSSAPSLHPPSRDTALVILLPPELAERADGLRADHDPTHGQWPPHITVVYPFVATDALEDALAMLALAMERQPALSLTLGGHRRFEHDATSTWWIVPEPIASLRALRDAIARLFPAAAAAAPSPEYHPHLTVAKTWGRAPRSLIEGLSAWAPSALDVMELAVLRRDEDGVARVHAKVPFGGEGIARGWLRAQGAVGDELDPSELLAWIEDAVPVTCHPTGSTRLGTELVGSDVDLVALTHEDEARVADGLLASARANPALRHVRDARDALAPSITFVWEGRDVDVMVARVPDGVDLGPAPPYGERERLGPAGRRALDTLATADALLDAVHALGGVEAYQNATRLLKWVARRRHIHRSAWGFLGGISWSIAATRAVIELGSGARAPEIAAYALELLATWSWPEPLTLRPGTPAEVGHRARVPIITPAAPFGDTAMRVTTATATVLLEEFERAASLLPDWGAILAPYEPRGACLTLEVRGGPSAWVDRDILTWVRDLEETTGAVVRPDPVALAQNTWRMELLTGSSRPGVLRALSERWTERWQLEARGSNARVTLA